MTQSDALSILKLGENVFLTGEVVQRFGPHPVGQRTLCSQIAERNRVEKAQARTASLGFTPEKTRCLRAS